MDDLRFNAEESVSLFVNPTQCNRNADFGLDDCLQLYLPLVQNQICSLLSISTYTKSTGRAIKPNANSISSTVVSFLGLVSVPSRVL